MRPYIYKTTDFGSSWQPIVGGLPERSFVRTVREDPITKDLLFAGTETGVYYSLDGGAHWQPLQLNMPVVPITDLTIKNDDLIAATQGRAFWVLDDITPLRALGDGATTARLFPPRDAVALEARAASAAAAAGVGQNPPAGAIITYELPTAQPVTIEFLDATGRARQEACRAASATAPPRRPACTGLSGTCATRMRPVSRKARFSPAATCAARSPHRGRIRCG